VISESDYVDEIGGAKKSREKVVAVSPLNQIDEELISMEESKHSKTFQRISFSC